MNKGNIEIIYAVMKWQANPFVHALTCGNDSSHRHLVPIEMSRVDGDVALVCPDCDYQQDHIPEVVLKYDDKDFWENIPEVFKKNMR